MLTQNRQFQAFFNNLPCWHDPECYIIKYLKFIIKAFGIILCCIDNQRAENWKWILHVWIKKNATAFQNKFPEITANPSTIGSSNLKQQKV